MVFSEKLHILRKNKGYTQEEFASKLGVSRQAVAKWESGVVYPDVFNLIEISNLLNVTIDYLVRDQECTASPIASDLPDLEELIKFRLEANVNTYAAFMNETDPSRPGTHDFKYEKGDYLYIDTYVGGEKFAGEEAVWKSGKTVYAMNYMGRVLRDDFSGNFLKEALRHADMKMPYRGPEYYESGEFVYRCKITGDFTWFQGYEEILRNNERVYECYVHGGLVN